MVDWNKWFGWLEAEPADRLLRPASPKELAKRSLVSIVNDEGSKVVARLKKGTGLYIGASQPNEAPPDLDLREYFDGDGLDRISNVHGYLQFLDDGKILYRDLNSSGGSVVERTVSGVLSPSLYLQILEDSIYSYLVTSEVVNAAKSRTPDSGSLDPPNGVFLLNQDTITPGLTYDVYSEKTGFLQSPRGGRNLLKIPEDVLDNGRLTLPRLRVYVE